MPPLKPLVPDYAVGDTRLADNPIIDSAPMDYLSRVIHSLVGGAGRAVGGAMKGMAENPKPLIAGTLAAGGTAMLMSNPATAAPIIAAMVSLGLPLTEAGLASLVSYTAYQQVRNKQMEDQGMTWGQRAPEAATNALAFGLPNTVMGNMLGNAVGTGITQGRAPTGEELAAAALTPATMNYVGNILAKVANQAPPLNRTGAIKLGGPTIGATAPNWQNRLNPTYSKAIAEANQGMANLDKERFLQELYPDMPLENIKEIVAKSPGVYPIKGMSSDMHGVVTSTPRGAGINGQVFTDSAAPFSRIGEDESRNRPQDPSEYLSPNRIAETLIRRNIRAHPAHRGDFEAPPTEPLRSRAFGGEGLGPINDRPVPAPWSHLREKRVETIVPEDPITKAMNEGAIELNRDYPEWKEGRNTLLSQADAIISHLLKTNKITQESANMLYRYWAQQAPKL